MHGEYRLLSKHTAILTKQSFCNKTIDRLFASICFLQQKNGQTDKPSSKTLNLTVMLDPPMQLKLYLSLVLACSAQVLTGHLPFMNKGYDMPLYLSNISCSARTRNT